MQTVRIRLRKPTRVFTFLCPDLPLKRDERCIVRTDRGLEYGICVTPPEACPQEMEERVKMTVVRKATPHDESSFQQLQVQERKARDFCAQRMRDRRLPMKLVDVEYTFDKRKVIFYFTAAERVDFRELVRDLAQELKTRIELRHIQVRDEAKLVGGLGMCGRALCCATWLREFHPISMKMAKRQNLSLNPSKISGQCSRLLCCLSYESDFYPDRKKAAAPICPLMIDEAPSESPQEEPMVKEGIMEPAVIEPAYAESGDYDSVSMEDLSALEDKEPIHSVVLDITGDPDGPQADPSSTVEPSAVPEPTSGAPRSRRRRRHRRKRPSRGAGHNHRKGGAPS